MRSLRRISAGAGLCLLALFSAGCEHISRSAMRKLSEYSYHRFATLDPAALRVAVERDARIQVWLEGTAVTMYGARGEKTFELARLSPSFRAESVEAVPGLPRATQGRAWTLLEIGPAQISRATEIQELIRLLSSPFYSPSKVGKQLQKMGTNDGIRWEAEGEKQFSVSFSLSFTQFPDEARDPLPCSVWVLIDPKDGYFQLIDNATF